MSKKIFFVRSINDTLLLVKRFSFLIKKPIYIYFSGDIGVGKSFFCRSLINNLGFYGLINSPSYTLINEYKCKNFLIYHFDLYRLLSYNDLLNIDIYEYFNKENICLVEWADKFLDLLPSCDLYFNFVFLGFKKRILLVKSFSSFGKYILNMIS